MKKVIKIISIALNILSVFALLLSAFLLIFTSFDFQKNFTLLNILSGSMEPSIKVGSVAVATKTDPNSLKVGDIINFSLPDNPLSVTHRLVEIRDLDGQKSYLTQGDANQTPDLNILKSDDIYGKIILIIPYLGYIIMWARQPIGFVLLIIVPAIIIIISEIIRIKKTIENEVSKKYEAKYNPTLKSLFLFVPLSIFTISLFTHNSSAYFSDSKVMSASVEIAQNSCKHPKDWFDYVFDKKTHKLKIIFKHCFIKNHWNRHFMIHYFAHGSKQEIMRQIPNDSNQEVEEFLGTCTTSTCTPDYDIFRQAEISLEDDETVLQYIDLN